MTKPAITPILPVLRKLAKIARIHKLYEGPPCRNHEHSDGDEIAVSQHGDTIAILTLGDCRKVRRWLEKPKKRP